MMRRASILDRYVFKEFLRLFLLMMGSFLSLYIIVDFFGRSKSFLSHDATFVQIASFFFYSTPQIISQTIPVAILVATLLTFGLLTKNHEIVAMKANGVSLYRISAPVFVFALVLCMASFVFNEFVVPASNARAKHIKLVEIRKEKAKGSFKQNRIWYKGRNAIYNFSLFIPETNTLKGISINYLSPEFVPTMRIDAREAAWVGNRWVCSNMLITRFPPGSFPQIERLNSGVLDIPESPEDFGAVQKQAEEMGFVELRDYIRKIRSEGFDTTAYVTDLQGKISFLLINIIVVIIGVSFSLRSERSGGAAQSLGAGIIIGFTYWVVFAFGLSLGRSGTLPPVIAAWLANAIFGLFSIVLVTRVRT